MKYGRKVHEVFAIEVMSGCGEKSGGLQVAKVLLLFIIGAREKEKSQKYAFLHYMKLAGPIDIEDETLGWDCLRRSTDDEVYHCLR